MLVVAVVFVASLVLVVALVVVVGGGGAVPVLGVGVGVGVVADGGLVVTLKLGPYDIIHPYNNYGVKLCAFFWRLCRFL